MNYVVLDLETANSDCSSICQVGFVQVAEGEIVGTGSHWIDPQVSFDPRNIKVHGIGPEAVAGCPTFSDVLPSLRSLLDRTIVVTHGSFDRVAIGRACAMRGLAPVEARWLDSQTVVRRTWTQFARKGYSLANLAQHLGIEFQHHDALEDAIATARILRRVLADSGRTASEWEAMVGAQARARVVRSGHSDGSQHLVNIDAASLTGPGVSPSR